MVSEAVRRMQLLPLPESELRQILFALTGKAPAPLDIGMPIRQSLIDEILAAEHPKA